MSSPSTVWRDPEVRFGRYKLLPVTDGSWSIYDPSAPLGRGTVKNFPTRAQAVAYGERLANLHPGASDHD